MIFKAPEFSTGNRRRKNRRRKHPGRRKETHLLEVKARSRKVKEQRRRVVFSVFCRLVLLASVAGGIYYGGARLLDHLFFSNEDYILKRMNIEGCETLSAEQLLTETKIECGQNLFQINLSKVKKQIEVHPHVQSVEVARILPDQLVIRVVEREPVAWLVPADNRGDPYAVGNSYLVDAQGVLIETKRLYPEYMHLPLITGINVDSLIAGQALDSVELQAALRLIILNNNRLADVPLVIRSIDLSRGYCLEVTDGQHAKYRMSYDGLELQLRKLDLLLEHANVLGRKIESINLVAQRNIPVRFLPVVNAGGEEVVPADGGLPVKRALPATQ